MTSYPFWVSLPDLGTVNDGYSFTANNVVLSFGETAQQSCVVSFLNGSLPPGITWSQQDFSVLLNGQIRVDQSSSFEWTFRINNGSFSSDRTFKIAVTKTSAVFEWETLNTGVLGYVFDNTTNQFAVKAQSEPPGAISYSIQNLNSLSKGISINSNSGEISVNIAWQPNTAYRVGQDYVYNLGQLYQCVIAGTSSPSVGPTGTGVYIVDTPYEPWQNNRFYPINSVVNNDLGKIYVCVSAGTSAVATGPTGTGTSIADGSVVWKYIAQSPAWDSIPAGDSIDLFLNIRATLDLQNINRTFNIKLLSVPFAPIWLSPSSVLANVPTQINFSYQLEAFDPDGQALTWSSSNLPSWLNLSNIGLLWGTTPLVENATVYSFDVSISDGISSVSRNFSILVTESVVELEWITASNLGILKDGRNSNTVVSARTARQGALLSYGLHGGMIPPNLIINSATGALEGFVEYHGQDRTYHFEVLVSDGVESLIKQFELTVQSQNFGQFYTLSIPLLGPERFDFVSQNNASIVDDDQLYLANDQGWGRTQRPQVIVSSGIKRINTQQLRNQIQNYLHNFRISFTQFETQIMPNLPYGLVGLQVRDADSMQPWQPQTMYSANTRVSNSYGVRYKALNKGVSGEVEPRGFAQNISDGTVNWSFDSVVNRAVDRTYPLPWYPYHYYTADSTVVNNGLIFRALSSGTSSGGPGPSSKSGSLIDNQLIWSYVADSPAVSPNTYWPSNIRNIRQVLTENVGWSNGWGSAASAVASVDTVSGAINSVTVLEPGSGFWASPLVNAVGSGSGASFEAKVGIVNAQVLFSDSGFVAGETFAVDLEDSQTQALLEVASIDDLSRVQTVKVHDPGKFSKIPSLSITLVIQQRRLRLQFIAGVVDVQIVNGGQGYQSDQTLINFAGQELDPISNEPQAQFDLKLHLAYADKGQMNDIKNHLTTAFNPFAGQVLPVTVLQCTVEGIQWQGYTRFDQNTETFDCNSTRLVDIDPASETVQDSNNTYWDDRSTTFDRNMIAVWPDYSNTYFDSHQTIFDYYRTLFDARKPVYHSRWSNTKLWFFGAPFDV